QAGAPLTTEHVVPQAPQFEMLVWRFTSQPSAAIPLQLAKPGLQLATAQLPATQLAVALGTEQTSPQAPQFVTLVSIFVSQPSAALLLQSAKPLSQLATVQTPLLQPAAPCAMEQAFAQEPQWSTLVLVLVSHPSLAAKLQSANP